MAHVQRTAPLPYRSTPHPRNPQATRQRPWHHIRDGFIVVVFLPTSLFLYYLRVEGLL